MQNRQPKGIPTGGEFARNDHGDAPGGLAESATFTPAYPQDGTHPGAYAHRGSDGILRCACSGELSQRGGSLPAGADGKLTSSNSTHTVCSQCGRVFSDADLETGEATVISRYDVGSSEFRVARRHLMEERGDAGRLTDAERLSEGIGVISISLEDSGYPEDAVEYISGQIDEGNTSGYYPTWNVSDSVDEDDQTKDAIILHLEGRPAKDDLDEVSRQLANGMTHGISPRWELREQTRTKSEQAVRHANHHADVFENAKVEEDDDEALIIVDDGEESLYLISVDSDGDTSSTRVSRSEFESDRDATLSNADWDTGYDA